MLSRKSFIIILISLFLIVLQFIFPEASNANGEELVKLQYRYNSTSNAVTIIATSETGFQKTKPTWSLSEDSKTYRKTYFVNESYYTPFVLKNGVTENVKINVTQVDDIGPQISIQYIYNDSDDTVTVKMTSNEVLSNTKPTWNLSEDSKIYTKKYYKNESYYTDVKDKYGNLSRVKLNIKQVKGPIISMQYVYDKKTNTVTATMKSNKKLADTKSSWNLSADKLTYTKKYDSNQTYSTPVQDTYGNIVSVQIKVTQIVNLVKNGIDVSVWQGNIDWTKVKKSGIDFAIIRAGYRGYGEAGTLVEDSMFSKNVLGAKSNNIDIGIYFFTQAITETEAQAEAKFVISLVKKYNINLKYPIVIDTEESTVNPNGRADGLDISTRTKVIKAFCQTIQNNGYTPMIYASKYWLMYKLDMTKLSNYDVWLAHYTSKTDYKGSYTMWQYTSSGSVNGISGNVDKNYCYKQY